MDQNWCTEELGASNFIIKPPSWLNFAVMFIFAIFQQANCSYLRNTCRMEKFRIKFIENLQTSCHIL